MSESHGGACLATARLITPRMPRTLRTRSCGGGTACTAASGDDDDGEGGSGGGGRAGGGGGGGGGGDEGVRVSGERSSEFLLVNVSRSGARRVLWVCEFGGFFGGLLRLGLEARAEFGGGGEEAAAHLLGGATGRGAE